MKKVISTAAMMLVSGIAAAQGSMTLWGRVDLGVQYVNMGDASRTGIDNGTYGTSRFGFRGVEDLGGGLFATFALEAAIQADVGNVGGGGKFFNRGSAVGLNSASLGSIDLGRQYVPIFWPFLWADDSSRWRLAGYSAVQSVQRSNFARVAAAASPIKAAGSLDAIGGGIYSVGITSAYEDNLIVYKSPKFNDISGSVSYGLGAENASDAGVKKNDGRQAGFNLEYKPAWGYLGVGGNRKDGATATDKQKLNEAVLSGLYSVTKELRVWGNVHGWSLDSGATRLKGRDAMLGVSYWLPESMLWANYAKKRINDCSSCGSSGVGVGYHYFLSKRTELYANYGHINNEGNAANSINGFVPTAPGKSVSAFAVGVGHSF